MIPKQGRSVPISIAKCIGIPGTPARPDVESHVVRRFRLLALSTTLHYKYTRTHVHTYILTGPLATISQTLMGITVPSVGSRESAEQGNKRVR